MVGISEPIQEKSEARARAFLIGLNFFAETNRMEPLVYVYLIEAHNWDVVWVGYVSIVMNVIMIIAQTPAGDLMDKTIHKKLIVAASLLTASITTMAVAWTHKLYAIILIKAVEGIAASIFLPGLMALLLGVIPYADVPKVVSLTEVSNKLGSVLFTVAIGFIAYYMYPDARYIFYLLGAGGLAAAGCVLSIPSETINNTRARNGEINAEVSERMNTEETLNESLKEDLPIDAPPSREIAANNPAERMESAVDPVVNITKEAIPFGYKEVVGDRRIVMFALLTFLYHLSNAAVVPLVAQLIAHEDPRAGLVFTSAVLCIFYLVQAPTAYIVGITYNTFGYKKLLMLGHIILPLRCTICGLLAMYYPNKYALVATQIFDGIGAGIYDTVMPLVVRSLVMGSGRFGVTFGFIVTCWRLGHGLSLLFGETILKAADGRYEVPFFVMGAGGLLACLMLAFGVDLPPPDFEEEDGPDDGLTENELPRRGPQRRQSSVFGGGDFELPRQGRQRSRRFTITGSVYEE